MTIFDTLKAAFKKRSRQPLLEKYTLHTVPTLASVITPHQDDGIGAVDIICSYFASLSLKVYSSRKKSELTDHWFSALIRSPNEDDVPFHFFYQLAHDYLCKGKALIYIYTDSATDTPTALFRIPPDEVIIYRDEGMEKKFIYRRKELTRKNILHIPSRFGFDGTDGKSIFSVNGETFTTFAELNRQLRDSTKDYALVGDRPVIDATESFEALTSEQQDAIRDKFIAEYSGVENMSKPIVLSGGMKLASMKGAPISQREQQFSENRRAQKETIAEIFSIPKGFFGGETNLDLEAMHILLLDGAIRPIALTFQQYFNKLLDRFDRGKTYTAFNFNSLLRTSLAARVDSYSKQLANSALTPNEIRQMEGRPASSDDAGDNLFIPANLIPLRKEQIEAYLASSRLKLKEAEQQESEEQGLLPIGDDKK